MEQNMTSEITFIDFAKIVLAKAEHPLSAADIWAEGVSMGLDKRLPKGGKTPEASLRARLYTAASNSDSGIVVTGTRTKRFHLDTSKCSEQSAKPEPMVKEPVPTPVNPMPAPKTYSFTVCARMVLEKFGEKKPMHYKDITRKAIELGWLDSNGLTPDATMYAQILTEIQRREKRGEAQRFVKHGKGYVGLAKCMRSGLRFEIKQHNAKVCKQLHDYLLKMPPSEFEELIGQLLGKMGYEDSKVTGRSGDGGVDVRGTWVVTEGVRIKMAVQVKRWKHNVTRPVIQNLRGSISTSERGLIITTSDFPQSAKEEAEDPRKASPISLINGERLVRLLVEYGIGITRESVDILDLDVGDSSKQE